MQNCLFSLVAIALITGLNYSCTSPSDTSAETASKDSISGFASFTEDGAWCWFSDPRALFYQGEHARTYAGWIDQFGNVTVGYYDHDTQEISQKVLHEELEVDDHDNPSLLIDEDGKLMVFYSKHSRSEPIYLMRAQQAESINEWEPRQELVLNDTVAYAEFSNTYTYVNIFRLSDEDNRLYLFWRGADFKPNVATSDDNGTTWSKGEILILPERVYRNRRPYLKASSNNQDQIHLAFTDGHPRNEPTNSIYYLVYRDGAFFKANGEKVANFSDIPIAPSAADMVYNATETEEKSWIWDVAENENGQPVISYVRFPDDSTHVYYYAVWDGETWQNHKITEGGGWFPQTPEGVEEREPNYSGGVVLDHQNPSTVYLSREQNGVFEIERWTTNDQGANWINKAITQNSELDNIRPFVVRNYTPDNELRVLWLNVKHYQHYTDYEASIMADLKSSLQ
ncbi:MAG: BNR-4 repeat-containing protein [Cyclobacteriaceae bacterium]